MTTPTDRSAPATKGPERAARPARRTMPAGRVFVVMLICMLLWTFLFSPTLKRSAEAAPDGARRSAALAVLGPFAAMSGALQVTKLTDAVEEALGRDPEAAPGGQALPPEPIPTLAGGSEGDPEPHVSGPIRKPTGNSKLRVVVVGDSLAVGLGIYLERALKPSLVRVSRQGRISTGLARPDYFDWPTAMSQVVDNFRPDLVVVMLGENDNQALRTPGGREETPVGTFGWPAAYEERVREFMELITARGSRLVWVGLPVVRDEGRWGIVERQNGIFEHAANDVRNVAFLDTWELFSAPDGGYTAYYRSEGGVRLIRESDGLHFNGAGYDLLARAAVGLALTEFELAPKVIAD
jgi:hypothetical protein